MRGDSGLFKLVALLGPLGLWGAGCGEPNRETFRAGAAVRDITPSFEVFVDENQNRKYDEGEPFEDDNGNGRFDSLWLPGRHPTEVHDPLWARSVALDFGGLVFTLTAVDSLGISAKRIDDMKREALELLGPQAGLSPERMVVASTHTHLAPDTIGIFGGGPFTPGWDEGYLQLVVGQGALSIREAVERLEPAELVVASARAGEGFVRDTTQPEIIDPYVGIIQARRPGGEALATLASIANHPEAAVAGNTLVSSDYPHFLRENLEEEFGGVAVHFSSDLGLMQTPAELGNEGIERARLVGEAYAGRVIDALSGCQPVPADSLSVEYESSTITAPLEHLEMYLAIESEIAEGYRDYVYHSESGPCAGSYGCFDMPVLVLELGGVLTLLTVPGEVTPELIIGGITSPPGYEGPYPDALPEPVLVDHLDTTHRFLIGLAGAEIGYIYPRMTYDPENCDHQLNGPGPSVALLLMTGLIEMLDRLE